MKKQILVTLTLLLIIECINVRSLNTMRPQPVTLPTEGLQFEDIPLDTTKTTLYDERSTLYDELLISLKSGNPSWIDSFIQEKVTLPEFSSENRLDFRNTNISDDGLTFIAAKFQNLTTLNLLNCQKITDLGLISLQKLKKLVLLNLTGCSNITDADREKLQIMLPGVIIFPRNIVFK